MTAAIHPLERAVALCRLTRDTFALHDPVNLLFLMERWNARAGVGLNTETIALLVQMVLHDRDPSPMTRRDADELVADVVQSADTLETARAQAQHYATIRGLEAQQAQRLDQLVRDRWHAIHAPDPKEVRDAA